MSEQAASYPETPSPQHMVNSLRGLLRRRNQTLRTDQPNRYSYGLGDFSGSPMERDIYSHVFALSALTEDFCLEERTRPMLIPAERIDELELQSKQMIAQFRAFLTAEGLTVETYRAQHEQEVSADRRVLLMNALTEGLVEQDSFAQYVAFEAQAAMHFAFDVLPGQAA